MRRAAVALLVACASCAAWRSSGRLLETPCTHLGVRPASDGWGDYAITVQLTTDWPACPSAREDASAP